MAKVSKKQKEAIIRDTFRTLFGYNNIGEPDRELMEQVLYYPGHQSTYYYNGDKERIKVVTKYVQYDE